MLPTSFHDVTALSEIGLDTWKKILSATGESARLNGSLTYDQLWHSLTSDPPVGDLLDVLEVLHDLGTDTGRELLLNAADDQQVPLGSVDDEPARELATRIWLQSQTDSVMAEVLMRARFSVQGKVHSRTYREFVGPSTRAVGRFDQQRLRDAIMAWCRQEKKSEFVQLYAYERDGEWRCEVLRGDALKRALEIKNNRPSILNFRPGITDHLRYDAKSGRLGIATRSPRLLPMYREVLGTLLADDAAFFSNENVCTLKPLQQHGRELFEQHRLPGILRVEVVELRWRRGDQEKLLIKGPDCFRILDDLGARLYEGELIEARLSIAFSGRGRRGRVDIKVPSVMDIRAGAHERLVEQLLDEVGIRGTFEENEQRLDLWALHPWRLNEQAWRRHIDGTAFDRLVQCGALRSVRLDAVTHPDHPAAVGALNVETTDGTTVVGVSDDPAIPLRTLTSSDVMGYELDISRVAREIATALELEGSTREIASGLWSLGRRSLSSTVSIAIFLASRMPGETTAQSIQAAANDGSRLVLLVPLGRSRDGGVAQVECRVPNGPYDGLVGAVVERLNVKDQVPPFVWLRDDLILDPTNGRAWYRRVLLSKLRGDSHPFKFAVAVARAGGQTVAKATLNALLSPASDDDGIAKRAKMDFTDRLQASFEDAGIECPAEAKDIFISQQRGYALKGSARVLEAR